MLPNTSSGIRNDKDVGRTNAAYDLSAIKFNNAHNLGSSLFMPRAEEVGPVFSRRRTVKTLSMQFPRPFPTATTHRDVSAVGSRGMLLIHHRTAVPLLGGNSRKTSRGNIISLHEISVCVCVCVHTYTHIYILFCYTTPTCDRNTRLPFYSRQASASIPSRPRLAIRATLSMCVRIQGDPRDRDSRNYGFVGRKPPMVMKRES